MEAESAQEFVEGPINTLLSFFNNTFGEGALATTLTVLVVLIVTALVAHATTKFLRKLLSHKDSPLPSSSIFINIARVVVWLIGIGIILSTCFNVDVSGVVAALGVGGLALSLGLKDTLSNLIGGLQMSIMGVVEPGDNISIAGNRGVVEDVTWRHVIVKTLTGSSVVVPNSVISTGSFVKLPPAEKVVVSICVSKSVVDLDKMAERMKAAVTEALKDVTVLEKEVAILFDSTTDLSYSGSIVLWIDSHEDALVVKDAAVRAVAPFYDGKEVLQTSVSSGEDASQDVSS